MPCRTIAKIACKVYNKVKLQTQERVNTYDTKWDDPSAFTNYGVGKKVDRKAKVTILTNVNSSCKEPAKNKPR